MDLVLSTWQPDGRVAYKPVFVSSSPLTEKCLRIHATGCCFPALGPSVGGKEGGLDHECFMILSRLVHLGSPNQHFLRVIVVSSEMRNTIFLSTQTLGEEFPLDIPDLFRRGRVFFLLSWRLDSQRVIGEVFFFSPLLRLCSSSLQDANHLA